MLHNLNTHQPGVPRGQNVRNCPQPEFSPQPLAAPLPMPAAAANPNASPEFAAKIAAILSIQPDGSQPLTQFSAEQLEACLWGVKWLHDFNLDRMPEPDFSDEVLGRLSDFHGVQMNDYFRRKKAEAAAA